jgi:hypothetical protein
MKEQYLFPLEFQQFDQTRYCQKRTEILFSNINNSINHAITPTSTVCISFIIAKNDLYSLLHLQSYPDLHNDHLIE